MSDNIIDEVCKELCFYDDYGPKCDSKCETCNNIYWRHFRRKVKMAIRAYEKMRGGKCLNCLKQ